MINAIDLLNSHDILFITLDSLRYDVARDALSTGLTPNLARLLPNRQWQERHSPGNFTFAAHQAFFAGFLPTPITPGCHARLFAVKFPGSETTTEQTLVFDAPDIISGFAQHGYRTICIGGVGFFNKQGPLGSVLPGLFQESYWQRNLGVTDPNSTENQVELAVTLLEKLSHQQRVFLFINISAIHQPNSIFLAEAQSDRMSDTMASHAAALAYVDGQLPKLFQAMQQRGPSLVLLLSDHGTAYGEDGYYGHRISHPVVWTVPYAEFILPEA